MGIKLISDTQGIHFYGNNSLLYTTIKEFFNVVEAIGKRQLVIIIDRLDKMLKKLINEHENIVINKNRSRLKGVNYKDTNLILDLNNPNDKQIFDYLSFLNFLKKSARIKIEEGENPFD